MPFSEIEGNWKLLSDDRLNEYIVNNDDYDIYNFLADLSDEDLELLLSKNTMLQNTSVIDDERGGRTEKKYYEYLLNDYAAGPVSRAYDGGLTSTSGYCYFDFVDSNCNAQVKYKLSIKVASKDTYVQNSYTLTVTKAINNPGNTALDQITFGKGDLDGNRTKLQKGSVTNIAAWDGEVKDGSLYRSVTYYVAVLHATVKKPPYTYAEQSVSNSNGNSIAFNNYNWKGDGSNTLNLYKLYKSDADDGVNIQLHLGNTGITADWKATHATRHVKYIHQKLKVNFYVNGGTVTATDYNTTAANPRVVNKVYNNAYSANGLPNPATFGFSKTGYHPKKGAEWKNGTTTWDETDTSVKCTDIYFFASGDTSDSGTFSRNLYVNWEANQYNVHFDGNGASYGSMSDAGFTYNQEGNLPANGFSRYSYKFKGWNTKADGSGTSYDDQAAVKNLTSTDNGTVTLYAQWSYSSGYNPNPPTPIPTPDPPTPTPDPDPPTPTPEPDPPTPTPDPEPPTPDPEPEPPTPDPGSPPDIRAQDETVLKFYEGEKVTKEDLLSNIVASDEQDGNLTSEIRITKIEYSDGKLLPDGTKTTSKELVEWADDMPDDYLLDTWFEQIDKEDKSVTHKIWYEVTDKDGNTSELEWKVTVKYNEYPEIKAKDYQFTIREAQDGRITKEALLKKARAWDLEDCKAHCPAGTHDGENCLDDDTPCDFTKDKLIIIGWSDDHFKIYSEGKHEGPSYEILNYKVVDQYGKETIKQFVVYISDDGTLEAEPEKTVRFIDWKNYRKPEGKGGLSTESLWYTDTEYVGLIEPLLKKIAEEPGGVPVLQQWVFSYKDIDNIRAYVSEHGIGNSKEVKGLENFLSEFSACRK